MFINVEGMRPNEKEISYRWRLRARLEMEVFS
jgi:hypothetical protein